MRLAVLGLLACCVAPGLARAGIRSDDEAWLRARPAAGFGIRFGSFQVERASTSIRQFHLDGGLRRDRAWLYVEYDLAALDIPDGAVTAARSTGLLPAVASGLVHRAAANLRWAVGRAGEHDGGGEIWAEAGAGVQHVAWDAGGTWTRPDLSLGTGIDMVGLAAGWHGGLSLGFRATFARRHDVGEAVTCAGPCDHPTAPTGWDHSFLFEVTILYGR